MVYNITATIVPYKFVPIMLENGWKFICFNPNTTAFRSTTDGSAVMIKDGDWITRQKDGVEKGIVRKRGEVNGDEIAPVFGGAIIPAEGNIIRVNFSKPTIVGPMGLLGLKLAMSGPIVHLAYLEMDASNPNRMIFGLDRIILSSETGQLRYLQPGGGIQDESGNDVPSFPLTNITNNSTQV